MSKFGERLQRLRQEKGLSRRQLEGQAGIPHGIVSRLERSAQRAYPSVPVAKQLAKVLGVTVDYLVGVYEDDDSELEPVLPGMA